MLLLAVELPFPENGGGYHVHSCESNFADVGYRQLLYRCGLSILCGHLLHQHAPCQLVASFTRVKRCLLLKELMPCQCLKVCHLTLVDVLHAMIHDIAPFT